MTSTRLSDSSLLAEELPPPVTWALFLRNICLVATFKHRRTACRPKTARPRFAFTRVQC